MSSLKRFCAYSVKSRYPVSPGSLLELHHPPAFFFLHLPPSQDIKRLNQITIELWISISNAILSNVALS